MQAEPPSTYGLLLGLLEPQPTKPSRLQRLLPSSGTLPQLNQSGAPGLRLLLPWLTGLRSLAQVIFINNPLSGPRALSGGPRGAHHLPPEPAPPCWW